MKLFNPQKADLKHYLFFTGKGGVGKTTIACSTAIQLAKDGNNVAIVSTDPASNLQDVFNMSLTNKLKAVPRVSGLFLANFDPLVAAKEYRQSVIDPYKGKLPDYAIKNMEEQLSGSCTTEIAAFDEFTNFLTDPKIKDKFNYIIFDTAPTGHTLRMLQLPAAWSNYLDENERGASCLGQLSGLGDKKLIYKKSVATLKSSDLTTLLLVARPQRAALYEAARASKELAKLGILNQQLIINGVLTNPSDKPSQIIAEQQNNDIAQMPHNLIGLTKSEVPLRPYNVVGLDHLANLLNAKQPKTIVKNIPNIKYPDLSSLVDSLINKKIIFTMGKGGVGKTTVAVQIAQMLAKRGKTVHLATTDPADHLGLFKINNSNITVTHINKKQSLQDYQQKVLNTSRKTMDNDEVNYIKEDLKSPCTQEIATFRTFADIIEQNKSDIIVIDTAPTGHTILLLDSTKNYAEQIKQTTGSVPKSIINLLPRLQDKKQTETIMVTLPEVTPIYESIRLGDDLTRAKIAHTWWVVNQSLLATKTTDPCLLARAQDEIQWINKVKRISNNHFVVEGWNENFEKQWLKA